MGRVLSDCFVNRPLGQPRQLFAFSSEALAQMVNGLPGLPVTLNFDHDKIIGRIITAELIGDKVIVEADIDLKYLNCGRNIVPAYEVLKIGETDKTDVYEYQDVKPVCCGLTANPIEKDRLEPMAGMGQRDFLI